MKYDPSELNALALKLEAAAKQALANAAVHRLAREITDAEREERRAAQALHFAKVCRYFEDLLNGGQKEKRDSKRLPTTPQSKRIASLFNRRHTTAWSQREVRAYKALGTITDEELSLLESYYASERAKGEEGIHRRDLSTFLNNFHGELDRARAAKPAVRKGGFVGDPEGWKEFCRANAHPFTAYQYAPDWLKGEFRSSKKGK